MELNENWIVFEEEGIEQQKLKNFKNDCRSLTEDIVVQKYLIDGASYFFQFHFDETL